MSDLASDIDAGEILVSEAVEKLARKDLKHQLLKFWVIMEGEPKPTEEREEAIRKEMKDRFWRRDEPWDTQPGSVVLATVLANYFIALQRALEGKEGDFE